MEGKYTQGSAPNGKRGKRSAVASPAMPSASDAAEQNAPAAEGGEAAQAAKAERHEDGGPTDAEVLALAKDLFPKFVDYWKDNHDKGREDVKVARLNDQWPADLKTFRTQNRLPMVTVNLLEKDVLDVVNEGRQNRASIKVSPVESGDKQVADAYQGLIRAIEQDSSAYISYDLALEHASDRSIGYVWVVPRYVDDDSFDQVIEIQPEDEPFSVFMDPWAKWPDGRDAEDVFRATDLPLERFKRKYPEASTQGFDASAAGKEDLKHWCKDGGKTVVVCDFLHAECSYTDKNIGGQKRRVETKTVWWFKVTANDVLERRKISGPYLPIARCLGRAIKLDGKLHTKSVVRNGIDPQRQYNYDRTLYQQSLGMNSKAHWQGTPEMFKGFEDLYDNSHLLPTGRLPYNPDPKVPGGKPELAQPRAPDAAAMNGATMARQDVYDATGIYPPDFGVPATQERSGEALRERKNIGNAQTFDFHDNQGTMIAHVGRILLGMIPATYDTERAARILGEDGTPEEIRIDPKLPKEKPVARRKSTDGKVVKHVRLDTGRYNITISTGPSYATRRQEGAEAMLKFASVLDDRQRAAVAPDIVRGLDFPGADGMADKLDLLVPPEIAQAKGMDGEDPKRMNTMLVAKLNELGQMNEQLTAAVQQMDAALQDKSTEQALEAARIEAGRAKELLEAQSTVQAAVINALGAQGKEAIRSRVQQLARPAQRPEPEPEPDGGDAAEGTEGVEPQ